MTDLAPWIGLAMLPVLGLATVATGLPVWALLVGVSSLFGVVGVVLGVMDAHILAAMPSRLVGLLESDLLQALPLYVFVGMLLQRLTVADALFSVLERVLSPLGAGKSLAALGVGALVAPMNGSVASSSALLARLVAPRLQALNAATSTALVSVAATIGVVVPPSLVLILLGDAMMRAHTEASHLPGFMWGAPRIINTQDVLHAALLPGLAIVVLWALVARWQGRVVQAPPQRVPRMQYAVAGLAGCTIVLLLAGVFAGKLFAVEAAATACMLLVLAAVFSPAFDRAAWTDVLAGSLELSGALMAMLIGATVFSLVFRLFGTDRWIADQLLGLPWPALPKVVGVLVLVALCAWVLDAFEMIFVVIPIVAPPLIALLGDAQQVAVLLLLVLQLSFLLPPMGYAVMMARARALQPVPLRALAAALLPFVALQLLVLAVVLGAPQLVHGLDAPVSEAASASELDLDAQMRNMADTPPAGAAATPVPEMPVPPAGVPQSR